MSNEEALLQTSALWSSYLYGDNERKVFNLDFRPYFGIGMVHLNTKFTKDMLPYWYRRMYDGEPGTFKRGRGGQGPIV